MNSLMVEVVSPSPQLAPVVLYILTVVFKPRDMHCFIPAQSITRKYLRRKLAIFWGSHFFLLAQPLTPLTPPLSCRTTKE